MKRLNPAVLDPPGVVQGLLVEEPLEVVKFPWRLSAKIGVPSAPLNEERSHVIKPTGQPVFGVQVSIVLSALWVQTRSAVFTFALQATRLPASMPVVNVNVIGAFTDTPVAPVAGLLKIRNGGTPRPGNCGFAVLKASESEAAAPVARYNPPAPEPPATASNKQLRINNLKIVCAHINRKEY